MELIVLEVEKQRPDMVGCILSTPFHLDDEVVFLSTSIGITFYPNNAKDIETLVKNADQAMYVAKSKGRNRF
jgi:diguanylate cyclase (GGDEF)-like protein